jgi:DNA polymerase-1
MPTPRHSRLFLIDGYALIYRAFFAMIGRPLTSSKGENTSATWGVANFLLRVIRDHQPEYLGWVHDAGSSFRHEMFPEYKATREKLEPELQEIFDRSVERVEALLAAFRVPLIVQDGYEADDVIGTLAARAADEGLEVVIVSGDKDFYQLVTDRISLLNPGRGGPAAVEEQWVNPSNAAERLGVVPERVVDYLALVGDSSDNVPGVRGVGDKTARKLIEEFGDLDSILAHAEQVTGKRAREALQAHADDAHLSRRLVTIQRDVPVQLDLETLRSQPADREALAALFAELEFHSLINRIQSPPRQVARSGSGVVTGAFELAEIVRVARGAEMVAIGAECSDANPLSGVLVGLTLAVGPGQSWYLPLAHRAPAELGAEEPTNLPGLSDPAMSSMVALLEDPAVAKAGHNTKFDWLVLKQAGVNLAGVVCDTMIASFLLEPGRRSHALGVVALDQFGSSVREHDDLLGKGRDKRAFCEIPPTEAAEFCGTRAETVLRLRQAFAGPLVEHGLQELLADVEMPLVPVLVEMEWRGIAVDRERLAELSRQFGGELKALEQRIHQDAGTDFNINSTPQLRHVLFEKLQLPVIKKTKTGASTDADVLAQLAEMGFTTPTLLLEYRELTKLRSTYVDVLPGRVNSRTGRIHTTFDQAGAATGRLSSLDPNLQNIPIRTKRGEEIRRCFIPAPGCRLIVADYSQIELRILAHLSEDAAFVAAFERGGDIHRETAAIIFEVGLVDVTAEMRGRAKTINFATIYGQGAFSLSRQLGISQDEAKRFIQTYFERFAGVRRFLDETIERARELGYTETILGRRRYIPELQHKSRSVRAFGERTAMNSPMQGSAADLIKIAMVRLSSRLAAQGFSTALLLQVHDELVLEGPDHEVDAACEIVKQEMEQAASLRVPLVVDVGSGDNWMDAKAS